MKVAVYARTSRQEGEDEGSIPVQLADCRERAEDESWEVVAEYIDAGISGWRRKVRPGYEQLYADAEAGRIDAVLCRDYERLLRNDREGQRWLDLHEARGFRRFAFADEQDIDLGRARDRKDWKERTAAAVYYSDRLGEKLRRTKRRQIETGEYTGGEREPFGYRRRNGSLEVDPAEAELLREAVRRLGSGQAMNHVIRDWNARNVKTSRGGRWRAPTLRRTLLSDHLTGARGYPRLLSDEEAAIARSALSHEERKSGRPAGLRAPLAGYLRCSECGTKLSTASGYYRCTVSHGGCGVVTIKARPLDDYVVGEATQRWLRIRPRRARPRRPSDTQPLLEELHRLEEREREIADALAKGELTASVAGAASRKIAARQREVRQQLAEGLPAPIPMPSPEDMRRMTPKDVSDGLRRAAGSMTAMVRGVLAQVLDHVVIAPREQRGPGFDPTRVTIEWRKAQ